jgi:hypothetical protein
MDRDIREILLSKNWTRTKTAIKNPHEYALRKNFGDDELFDWCVQFIRDNGYEMWFWKKRYICYDIDGYKYWTMGFPINGTILINRAVNKPKNENNNK